MMDRSQMITAKNCATDVQKWTNRNKFDNFDLFGFLNTTESIRPLFHLLPFVFSNKQCKIFNKLMWSNIHLPSFERRLQLTVKNCAANIWKRKVEELDTDLFGLWLNMYGRTRPLINLLSIFSNKQFHFYDKNYPTSIRCWDSNTWPLLTLILLLLPTYPGILLIPSPICFWFNASVKSLNLEETKDHCDL